MNSNLSLKGRISEIIINKECGKHAEMRITVIPDEINNINDLFSFTKTGTSVEADIDGSLIMCGKVRDIFGQTTYSGSTVTILVVSDSNESDITKISRVFQSPEKKYKSVLEKISGTTVFEIKKDELSSKVENCVLIQNNETDFEFVNRIAREKETNLFVCADERGRSKVIIADSLSKTKTLKKEDIITAKIEISEYIEAMEVEYREYIELGTKVKFDTYEYVVVSLQAIKKNGADRFFMKLKRKIKESEPSKYPINLISLGKAKVTDNKDPEKLGRIQVEFLELEDSINDKKMWIQYINTLTAGEGGVFYVPDKEEIVEVICQNGICYAYGCVREKPASEKINNTDNKSLMLYNKTLIYEDKKITFEAGDYTAQVNEDEINIKNNKYNIIMSKDNVIVGSDKNVITIRDDKIDITVNNKGNFTIKDSSIIIDANSKVEVTNQKIETTVGNGKVKLSSGKLDISAASGVDVSTMKFNVK